MITSQTIVFRGTDSIQMDIRDGGLQDFLSTVGAGVDFEYWITSRNGGAIIESNSGQWENGIASLSSGGLLTRKSITASSLGTTIVPFNLDANIVTLVYLNRRRMAYKTADQTGIGTSFADVTGLGFSVAAGLNYAFEYNLIMDADATTTALFAAVNGPASPTSIYYTLTYWTSAPASAEFTAAAYDAVPTHSQSQGTARSIYVVKGILRNGANAGTLIPRASREAGGSGNVRIGSYGIITQL
jgi:hypothetical protein